MRRSQAATRSAQRLHKFYGNEPSTPLRLTINRDCVTEWSIRIPVDATGSDSHQKASCVISCHLSVSRSLLRPQIEIAITTRWAFATGNRNMLNFSAMFQKKNLTRYFSQYSVGFSAFLDKTKQFWWFYSFSFQKSSIFDRDTSIWIFFLALAQIECLTIIRH